jgi:hypothetical protein
MTWIEGSPLAEFFDVFPLLAEDLGEPTATDLAVRWLREACEALGVLHRNGLIHQGCRIKMEILSRLGWLSSVQ